ncbi:MAG: nucleotidyl transferase AbiEii/AbiGii toxin family protein, partial [Thermomicrobiales bacterium]
MVQVRKQIAFDRFLARLLAVAPDTWLLKGGTALYFRIGEASRFTKDLDLVLPSGADLASDTMSEAVAYEVEDFFSYSLQHAHRLDHGTDGSSLRFAIRSELDGRLFENIIVDIGFDELSPLPAEIVTGTDFLQFAGIPAITCPMLPIEVHLSEKVHAFA